MRITGKARRDAGGTRAEKAEMAAIRKGRAAIKRGEFVTLEKLLDEVDNPRRKRDA
jgi:predicted transcriptional regulator